MRIGIDARLFGSSHTGLGRYTENLVENLLKIDTKNEYVLFVSHENKDVFPKVKNLKKVVTNIKIYTFAEQLLLPLVFLKEKLDLLHVPYFNAPLLYPKKTVITVHDLIKHFSKGKEATTHPWWMYALRRIGYHIETIIISFRASRIIVPTNFVRDQIRDTLKVPMRKIFVTPEAVSSTFRKIKLNETDKSALLKKYNLKTPFVVYTGNLYPHKNIDRLIDAVIELNTNSKTKLTLAVSCARSVFWDRLLKKIENKKADSFIKLLGFLDDEELSKVYSLSLALVHPSKMEGFGLTGLEAMSVGLPVISSNSPPLPEVYQDSCLYFNPDSTPELVSQIKKIISSKSLSQDLVKRGFLQSAKFSWLRMAKETLKVYESVS